MANWKYVLDLAELFDKASNGKITSQQFSASVVAAIKASGIPMDEELAYIVNEFESISITECDFEHINELLKQLYDWGDAYIPPYCWPPNKLCWIASLRRI